MDQTNSNNIIRDRDPQHAKSRVFVGNLPENCTREELESVFQPYGKIIGVLVQKNFGFVQFENQSIADRVVSVTKGSLFKGKKLVVRNAGIGKPKKVKGKAEGQDGQTSQMTESFIPIQQHNALSLYHANANPDYNDCEVIVVNKLNTEYAEYIEQRLKRLGLKVDLLFPNEEVPIGKVLANISSRGCLYAILITEQHEEHRSITVNILYGEPAEHRNMPVEDAVNLISTNFQEKLKEFKLSNVPTIMPISVPIIPSTNSVVHPLKERHPEAIQAMLNLLADNMPLTVLQYDRVIKYLSEQRELQVRVELGDSSDIAPPPVQQLSNPSVIEPDPEIELQKKILNILNKPSITDKHDLVYPTINSLRNEPLTIELLKDVKIQRALDSLMKTNLVSSVENNYKF